MKIKVLVVDDNEVSVSLMKKYFNGGNDISIENSVFNGQDAIEILCEDINYDIVLLDLIMPVKDGFAVLEFMKNNNINIPVIVMSSFNDEDTIRKVSEYGVKYYALKPFNLDDVGKRIIDIFFQMC